MRKEELLTFPGNQTDFFNPQAISEVFTARYLAERFAMQRHTASHYLNQRVTEGALVKINTRTVYFLHKLTFCQHYFPLSRNEYASVADLLAEGEQELPPPDHFSLLIGHDESLKKTIEQMKTALFYPDGGLPLFLVKGEGKCRELDDRANTRWTVLTMLSAGCSRPAWFQRCWWIAWRRILNIRPGTI